MSKAGLDAPVLRWRDADSSAETGPQGLEETLYFCHDANMNVTALVKVVAGSARVVERYACDPYGRLTVLNGESGHDADGQVDEWSADADGRSDWGNAVLFAGYRRDAETGLHAVRHRTLHPHLGWLQRDPIGYVDGMSLYEYCRGTPASTTDPNGLSTRTEAAASLRETANALRAYARSLKESAKTNQLDAARKKMALNLADRLEEAAKFMERGLGSGQGHDNIEEFSFTKTFLSELAQRLDNVVENTLSDVLMPWRRVDRAVADYEADRARGLGVFDAVLNAFGKNAPLVSSGWGLGEAIEGKTKGGVDHGRSLEWYDRAGRVGEFIAVEAGAAAWAAARWNAPSTTVAGGKTVPKGATRAPNQPLSSGNKFIVDPKGNTVVVKPGETVTSSPDGKWIQVHGADGKPTGMRLDGAHKPSTHPDPRAQQPHAHVPGVTNPDGTPWLPVNQ